MSGKSFSEPLKQYPRERWSPELQQAGRRLWLQNELWRGLIWAFLVSALTIGIVLGKLVALR